MEDNSDQKRLKKHNNQMQRMFLIGSWFETNKQKKHKRHWQINWKTGYRWRNSYYEITVNFVRGSNGMVPIKNKCLIF